MNLCWTRFLATGVSALLSFSIGSGARLWLQAPADSHGSPEVDNAHLEAATPPVEAAVVFGRMSAGELRELEGGDR